MYGSVELRLFAKCDLEQPIAKFSSRYIAKSFASFSRSKTSRLHVDFIGLLISIQTTNPQCAYIAYVIRNGWLAIGLLLALLMIRRIRKTVGRNRLYGDCYLLTTSPTSRAFNINDLHTVAYACLCQMPASLIANRHRYFCTCFYEDWLDANKICQFSIMRIRG